jgi:hypothetical protein
MLNTIKIKKTISDENIRIEELKEFQGKVVNIIIFPDTSPKQSALYRNRIPSWVGKYSGNEKVIDDRIDIYQ